MPRAYKNPTEDAAIGNIIREERRKQRSAARNVTHSKKRSLKQQHEKRRLKHKREG